MRLWHVQLLSPDGKIQGQWVVFTFGGDSILEVSRQGAEASRLVIASPSGPPASVINDLGCALNVVPIDFSVTGVAEL